MFRVCKICRVLLVEGASFLRWLEVALAVFTPCWDEATPNHGCTTASRRVIAESLIAGVVRHLSTIGFVKQNILCLFVSHQNRVQLKFEYSLISIQRFEIFTFITSILKTIGSNDL